MYDEILATTSEEHLQEKVNELKVVLNLLLQDLNEKDNEELFWIQSYYSEQEVLETLIKLAELNFYKSTRVEERAVDLLGKSNFRMQTLRSNINDNSPNDEIGPEMIAGEYLTDLNIIILKVIFLLIKNNWDNWSIVIRYDELIYKQKEIVPESENM